MKAPLIQIKNLHISVSTFMPEQLTTGVSFLEPVTVAPATPARDALTPPAIGEYWAGQGGIYGGIRLYPEGLCHVIFAATDVGKHAWSKTGFDLVTSRTDGRANSAALIADESQSPAAEVAANYTADGHQDFYLPSIGELNHAWQFIPESFEKGWYISSTQFSVYTAYNLDFSGGYQDYASKYHELSVRPARRFLR